MTKINTNKVQLSFVFLMMFALFTNYKLLPFLIPLFIFVCYYKLIKEKNILDVLILIIMSRIMQGFFIPKSDLSYNILNILCNYLPTFLFLLFGSRSNYYQKQSFFKSYKWTLLYAFLLLILSTYNISYAFDEFPQQLLPILFFVYILYAHEFKIDTVRAINFFRVLFLATLVTYFLPDYTKNVILYMTEGIVFKDSAEVPLEVSGIFWKNAGFTFDWRIVGQFAIIYLLLIIEKSKNKYNWYDHLLIIFVLLTTFSRGPIVIAVLIYSVFLARLYFSFKPIKRLTNFLIPMVLILFLTISYITSNKEIINYLQEYNLLNESNAISQRGGFSTYALEKAKGNLFFGLGIGSLSSLKADNLINFGYSDINRLNRVWYYAVVDAYWALSIGEKGLIGTFVFILSLLEIFYRKKDFLFLFLVIGFSVNLIGTDIPKEGMYYFAILIFIVNINPKGQIIAESKKL